MVYQRVTIKVCRLYKKITRSSVGTKYDKRNTVIYGIGHILLPNNLLKINMTIFATSNFYSPHIYFIPNIELSFLI